MNCQAVANKLNAKANMFADIMLAMEFQDWLVEQLNLKGWNQAKLASRAGVTRTAISDIISGRRNAGSELCTAIAHALNLPPEEVFRAAGLLPPAPAHTEQTQELLYFFDQLDDHDRKTILDLARFLLSK